MSGDGEPAREADPPVPRSPRIWERDEVRRGIVAAIWFAALAGLGPFFTWIVPNSTKAKISLTTFSITCQVLTLAIGIGAGALLLRSSAAPKGAPEASKSSLLRDALGFASWPRPTSAASVIALAPFVFVASTAISIQIALPTLMDEFEKRGGGASQQNAGAFGQAVTAAPVLITLLWGAFLGAAGEELFFRGILWRAVQGLLHFLDPKPPEIAPISAPGSAPGSASRSPAQKPRSTWISGMIATVACAALFGWMHHDMPGGVGIVRVASTTCLGLASGLVRHATGGVLASIALHLTYNTLVIGNSRKWFASEGKLIFAEVPVPNPLVYAAGVGILVAFGVWFLRTLLARRAASAFVPEA